jgi:hypothetical protein
MQSKWYGYLQCIPAFEPLPMYWDSSELAPLQGTELTYILDNDKVRTRAYAFRPQRVYSD